MLQDVVVTQSKARTRETPVAISELTAGDIEAKLGNKEFPEVLKNTPGVWATPEGGGYGDAKINMRGFKAPNVAVLVNGVPMNDMEWGGIYWSNFAGLSGVTSSMQTQRGLGAAIISAPLSAVLSTSPQEVLTPRKVAPSGMAQATMVLMMSDSACQQV